MSAPSRPEAWLRGPLPSIDPVLMPAAHTLVQAREAAAAAAAGEGEPGAGADQFVAERITAARVAFGGGGSSGSVYSGGRSGDSAERGT